MIVDAKDYILKFGKKHKGKTLEHVPLLYLDFILGLDYLFDNTREAVERYLKDPAIARDLERQLSEKEARGGN